MTDEERLIKRIIGTYLSMIGCSLFVLSMLLRFFLYLSISDLPVKYLYSPIPDTLILVGTVMIFAGFIAQREKKEKKDKNIEEYRRYKKQYNVITDDKAI